MIAIKHRKKRKTFSSKLNSDPFKVCPLSLAEIIYFSSADRGDERGKTGIFMIIRIKNRLIEKMEEKAKKKKKKKS